MTSAGLASGQTPLPVRFGEAFDSDDACRAAIAGQEAEFLAVLERIAGRVEMTVAIPLHRLEEPASVQPVDVAQASPGRAYLERLRGERQDAQILQQQGHVLARPVVNAVRRLVIDERATLRPSPPTYLVSHLIARSAVEEYRRLVSAACDHKALERDFWQYCHTDQHSDRVGELAFGTNLGLREMIGILLQDEKVPGVHIAFGDPYGSQTRADWKSTTSEDATVRLRNYPVQGSLLLYPVGASLAASAGASSAAKNVRKKSENSPPPAVRNS